MTLTDNKNMLRILFIKIKAALNKEMPFRVQFLRFDLILGTLAQSIIYTILISYVIYNLMVLINPNPNPDNLLEILESRYVELDINIFTDQATIFKGYMEFLSQIVTLDLGLSDSTYSDRYNDIMISFTQTLKFLFSTEMTSLAVLQCSRRIYFL